MEFIPIPYFGMIMSLLVLPGLTFGFIIITKKIKADVEKIKYQKEILELEIRKETVHLEMIIEENKKYDKLIESNLDSKNEKSWEKIPNNRFDPITLLSRFLLNNKAKRRANWRVKGQANVRWTLRAEEIK